MMCIALSVLSALSAHDLLFTLYLCINDLRQEVTIEWSKMALSSFVACSAELAAYGHTAVYLNMQLEICSMRAMLLMLSHTA